MSFAPWDGTIAVTGQKLVPAPHLAATVSGRPLEPSPFALAFVDGTYVVRVVRPTPLPLQQQASFESS